MTKNSSKGQKNTNVEKVLMGRKLPKDMLIMETEKKKKRVKVS